MDKKLLAIYIVTRDRPEFLKRCINSVLNQSHNSNFKIIISDNSLSDSTKLLAKSEYQDIPYIYRDNLTAFQHFQSIVDENECDYLLMLHDDDSLQPEYVELLFDAISSGDAYSAIAVRPNYINLQGEIIGKNKDKLIKENLEINSPIELISHYFYKNKGLNPPFSGYAYKKSNIDNIRFNSNEAGKYSDVTFLLKILDQGKFLWLSNRLINVGLHDHNDSNTESMASYFKLINFIQLKYSLTSDSIFIRSIKIRVYIRYIARNLRISKRNLVLLIYLIKNYFLIMKIIYFRKY